MTPTPSPHIVGESSTRNVAEGDEICISGISGAFPDSDNVAQLAKNLFDKVDLISDDDRRWKLGHPEIPQRTGKINNVNKFDASFFGVHFKQANSMDPMSRILIEKTYEAVVDAGVNPRMLRGSNTGVFIGSCFSESEKTWLYEKIQANGLGMTGVARAMLANRISFWLGCTGPSYNMDSACSSSLYAMEHAYRAISEGRCDAAIVGGSNLCLHPYISLQFSRLGVLSPEGKCKSFDNSGAGYVRAEAIVVVYLQKAKNCKRVYAQVVHARTNCDGFKEQGITHPSGAIQKQLFTEFYKECNVSPLDIEFVEAHGTGTKVGDPEELNALDQFFCTGRKAPLKIGSIKSNMGHAECASGLCAIAKMCIAYHTGYIPPNLHYSTPREGIPALVENRFKVVTEKTPWNRGFVGVNSFGFGGANAHVLLKHFSKPKINNGAPKDDLPRLICISGRTESAVNRILDDLESRPIDVENIALYHSVHNTDIFGHVCRGYTLLRTNKDTTQVSREVQHFTGVKRPIWFVFSGMGSQWPTMGTSLLKIPIFAAAIEKCHKILSPKGVDVKKIITDPDPKLFDNVLNSFVGIAAVQIGLCDILKAIGIEADYLIGHSVGEVVCSYADGCFTAEETIMCAYSRGLASIEAPLMVGSMAAIGLGYEQVKDLLPPSIEVACHNGPDSSTISGPVDDLKKIVKELHDKGIFAKEVACSNIAYHSKYIATAGPILLKYLRKAIPKPKKRSSKWVSTSVPIHLWDEPEAQYSSPEYHTNNLLSPVLFEETCRLIPANAVTIEISPHGLLQAILNRSLSKECTNIPLAKRGAYDNVENLFTAFGKLFEVGLNPQLANLYPKVDFPVSNGTPMISPLIEWEHSDDWFVMSYKGLEKLKSGERTVRMAVHDDELEFMKGHVVDDRNLYPATGYLLLVWETLGMMRGELFSEVSVVFENVRFMRATNIPKDGNLEFTIMVNKGSGNFEIIEGDTLVVSGKIYAKNDIDYKPFPEPIEEESPYIKEMSTKDVYKELRLRGYNYSGLFRGIQSCAVDGSRGILSWDNNWVTFMDTILQMQVFCIDTKGLYVPTRIEKISIDVVKQNAMLSEIPEGIKKTLPVTVYKHFEIIRSGGVEIHGLVATPIAKKKNTAIPVLEKYQFLPNFPKYEMCLDDAIRSSVQLFLENEQIIKVKVLELIDEATENASKPFVIPIGEALFDLPLMQAELIVLSEENLQLPSNIVVKNEKLSTEANIDIMIGSKLLNRTSVLNQAMSILKNNSVIISREKLSLNLKNVDSGVEILLTFKLKDEMLVVLKKKPEHKSTRYYIISETDENFNWIDKIKTAMTENGKIVLIAENERTNGLLGFVNCLRKEPGGEFINCLIILDPKAPKFDCDLPFYKTQLDKDLAVNIYKDGQWGTYRHLKLEELASYPALHAYVNVTNRGDMSSLKWLEGPLRAEHCKNSVHVYYSAVNFRDIMTSSGRISVEAVAIGRLAQECVQGMEFSGKTESGIRVIGLLKNKGLCNIAEFDEYLLWPIPDNWSLEEAATVPIVYSTIIYAFIMVGRMKRGESVLIHAGTGGVGQAAINFCLYHGCKIFTTVGTPEKRAFLKKLFPQIPDNCIGNSRDTSFEQMIMHETQGKGVDLVLNSLSEEKLQASVRCLALGGRFLEIGKFDIVNNAALGMSVFMREASFYGIMLDLVLISDKKRRRELSGLLYEGMVNGSVKPLVRTIFDNSITEVERAFRTMAAGKHIGKILIKIRDEEPDIHVKPTIKIFNAMPKYIGYPNKSYVIIGGLGGFGLELVDWLILQGAKVIVLNSRRGVTNGYQALRIRTWNSYGIKIVVNTDDITTQAGCSALLKSSNDLAPVQAIFNLAVVLKDAIFENQTPKSFMESFGPKAKATKYLDIESRKLCPQLANFVIFSSVSCGRGNAGQTNYGMANSIMERICEERKREGYPALTIQWGAVGDVGLVADMQEDHHEIIIGGTVQQRITCCLKVLNQFLKYDDHAILSSMVVAEKKAATGEVVTVLTAVAAIMNVRDMKTVSHQLTLTELGMDSMMSVEIKQTLEREFELFLTAKDIRNLTFSKLQELSVQQEIAGVTNVAPKDSGVYTDTNMLIRNFGDELIAKDPIVNFPTMLGDAVNSDLIDGVSDPYLFMFPGLEGVASVLESLSKMLKCRVAVLQYGLDDPFEDVPKIANRLFTIITSLLPAKSNFMLLGYSFGTIIALEVAKLLEAEGYHGKIFFLDGSPEYLTKLLTSVFNTKTPKLLENALIARMLNVVVPRNDINLTRELDGCDTWDAKLDKFLTLVPDKVKHSKVYLRSIFNSVYGRINAVLKYEAKITKKITCDIILMRPKELPFEIVMDNDYGLSQFVEKPVNVHLLEGNHITIVESKDTANIINQRIL